MQPYSKSITQSYRDSGGDLLANLAVNQVRFPGFSAEQTSSILSLFAAVFNQHVGPVQQSNPSPPTPPHTQSNSLAKKKRNQKTRNQYKKKAQAQRITMVQVQEVDHSQEVEHLDVQIGVNQEASKHVVLQPWMTTESLHAAIPCVGMAFIEGMILIGYGTTWRPRMGVG